MPVLIDGYNVLHAARGREEAADWGRQQLCRLLAAWARRGREEVVAVFDGAAPSSPLAEQLHGEGIDVRYSGPGRSADQVLAELIQASSAPRRLLVVSSDRQVQRAARRRRCRHVGAAEFLAVVFKMLADRKSPAAEPPEKRAGPASQDVNDWLRVFGYDPQEEVQESPEV